MCYPELVLERKLIQTYLVYCWWSILRKAPHRSAGLVDTNKAENSFERFQILYWVGIIEYLEEFGFQYSKGSSIQRLLSANVTVLV